MDGVMTQGEQARDTRKKGIAREAFEKGLTRYFTGKPCKYGHIAERMIRNGQCVECLRRNHREYAKRHPETHKRAAAKYRAANIEVLRERGRAEKARLRAGNPHREKERQQRFHERKEGKLATIAGRPRADACEICGDTGKTVFDHCHASGKFRGWLCDRCNRTLGQVKDSVGLLAKMITYLEANNAKSEDDSEAAQQLAG